MGMGEAPIYEGCLMTPGRGHKGTGASSDTTGSVAQSPDVPSTLPQHYEPSHVIQMLVAMQGEIKALCTKTERLISDVEKLDGHVAKLNTAFNRAWGFGLAAVILIPVAATLIWWLIGGQITQLRDRINSLPQAQMQQSGNQNANTKP